MNKKKIWIPVVALVLVAAAVAGILLYPRNAPDPVQVFPVEMLSYIGSQAPAGESSGVVTADKVQTVYVSSTQNVKRIHVYEGQKVKAGDLLYTYDTTLSDLTLERKDLSIQQMEMNLKNAKEELTKLKAMKPMVVTGPSNSGATPGTGKSPADREYLNSIYAGSGTSGSPYKFWISRNTPIYEELIWEIIGYSGRKQVYVIFQMTKNDAANAEFTSQFGVKFEVLEIQVEEPEPTETEPVPGESEPGGEPEKAQEPGIVVRQRKTEKIYVMSFFDPNEKNSGTQIDWNSGYTQSELVSMREQKQNEIAELEFNIKISKAELKIMRKEASDGNVYAEFDGTVVSVVEPESARALGQPMLKIAGGGGYYVEGAVSELLLGTIEIGQTVQVKSMDTGAVYSGTISQIGAYPAENSDIAAAGTNVTYYPYRVFVDESADLQEGAYVTLTYLSGQGETGVMHLENAFIRTDGKESFVYVRGEGGLLEKRVIQTGACVDGYSTPVYAGLTVADYIAFPYGDDILEGAETVEAGIEALYGG